MSGPLMTIDGRRTAAATAFGVVDPAIGAGFAEAPDCTREQLDAAIAAATVAGRTWREDEGARIRALGAMADKIDANAEELAALLTAEQGKPLAAARFEISETTRWLRASTELGLPVETILDDGRVHAQLSRRPIGVVGAITPWNYPLLLAGWKLGPALRAGNAVVLKPSPFTPLSTLRLGEIVNEVLPPGVVSVVSGGDDLGAWMTAHPAIGKISFTGSVATGKAVMAASASTLKRLTLELGGNDAAIVLDDADPQAIGKGLFWGAFINNGQICAGVKRVFVPESLHDEVVGVLAERARRLRIGPGVEPGVHLGPIQNRMQFDRVSGLVADALSGGASAVVGGRPGEGPGYFFPPTILTGVREGMRIVDEEQFGPALPVLSYRTVDEAVERANATRFGLSGSVWGTDLDRAAAVAGRLDCGTAFVNDHLALDPALPFGGSKESGIGVENGPWGLDEFTQIQVLHRPKA
jgi:acyl-CoA reductase-like NAD-dependent aldehyde dehydrogenase